MTKNLSPLPKEDKCALTSCTNYHNGMFWHATNSYYCYSCATKVEKELLGDPHDPEDCGYKLFVWMKMHGHIPMPDDYERFNAV